MSDFAPAFASVHCMSYQRLSLSSSWQHMYDFPPAFASIPWRIISKTFLLAHFDNWCPTLIQLLLQYCNILYHFKDFPLAPLDNWCLTFLQLLLQYIAYRNSSKVRQAYFHERIFSSIFLRECSLWLKINYLTPKLVEYTEHYWCIVVYWCHSCPFGLSSLQWVLEGVMKGRLPTIMFFGWLVSPSRKWICTEFRLKGLTDKAGVLWQLNSLEIFLSMCLTNSQKFYTISSSGIFEPILGRWEATICKLLTLSTNKALFKSSCNDLDLGQKSTLIVESSKTGV